MQNTTESQQFFLKEIDKIYKRHFPNYDGTSKVLEDDEVKILYKKYKEEGDLDARDRIIYSQLKLVYHYTMLDIKRYNIDYDLDDYIQTAYALMVEKFDYFDPKKGNISTYYRNFNTGHLKKKIKEVCNTVRLPVNQIQNITDQRKYIQQFFQKYERSPIDGDTIEIDNNLIKFNSLINFNVISSDIKVNEDGDRLVDLIPDKKEEVEFYHGLNNTKLKELVSSLQKRDREILEYCVMREDLSQDEIVQCLTPMNSELPLYNKRSKNLLKVVIDGTVFGIEVKCNAQQSNEVVLNDKNLPFYIQIDNIIKNNDRDKVKNLKTFHSESNIKIKPKKSDSNVILIHEKHNKSKTIKSKRSDDTYLYKVKWGRGYVYTPTNLDKHKKSLIRKIRMNKRTLEIKKEYNL